MFASIPYDLRWGFYWKVPCHLLFASLFVRSVRCYFFFSFFHRLKVSLLFHFAPMLVIESKGLFETVLLKLPPAFLSSVLNETRLPVYEAYIFAEDVVACNDAFLLACYVSKARGSEPI